MTSFRFHTNFTNPLKITIILPYQQSPTTPNCCSSPDTGEQAFSRRCLSATVTDVVVLEPKRLQTAVALQAFSQGLANSCRGENRRGSPLLPHLVKNRAHIGANLQSTQHPVDRITGRPLVKITVSLQLLPLMLGKSSNSHFQDPPSKHPTARNSQQCCDM